jgi:hypothetical protein
VRHIETGHVLTASEALLLRLRSQRLDGRQEEPASAVGTTRELCGVQAQEAPAAALALRARCGGLTAAAVERARSEERAVVRTWCMRHTLHLLAADDLGWILPLLSPSLVRASRRRRAELDLNDETYAGGLRALRVVLGAEEPLTRPEISERLAARGIRLEGQAIYHLLSRAALEGFVCLGLERGSVPTYVPLGDWTNVGRALPRESALAELALRYLGAYGPAGPEDLSAWSGLPVTEARRAWALVSDKLVEVRLAGKAAWMLGERAAWMEEPSGKGPVVRLLPKFDPYLLGYRGRDLAVAPEHARRVHPGGGVLRPVVLVDGRALGTWTITRRRERLEVVVEAFEDLGPDVRAGLDREAGDLARFLGAEAALVRAGT